MGSVIIHNRLGPRLTDREIISVEEQLGVSLPADYAAFLREHNGGSPEPNVFPIADYPLDTQGILAFLFGVKRGAEYDLVESARIYHNRVPAELLPIGSDVFGNAICLAVSGPNTGKVYWWFHEEESDEDESPTYDNVYFVSNSFTDLLTSLAESSES